MQQPSGVDQSVPITLMVQGVALRETPRGIELHNMRNMLLLICCNAHIQRDPPKEARNDPNTHAHSHSQRLTDIQTHTHTSVHKHTHTHKHTLWRCAVDRKRETWLERQDLRGGERVGVKMCAFDYRERERESKREKEGEDREIYRA